MSYCSGCAELERQLKQAEKKAEAYREVSLRLVAKFRKPEDLQNVMAGQEVDAEASRIISEGEK